MPARRTIAAVAAVLVLASAGLAEAAHPVKTTATAPSVALTTTRVSPTHFGIGVLAAADSKGIFGWMPRTKVPWDYAYRYIGGGLNTGGTKNWTAWATNATFPLTYAQAAQSEGYTPVFSYYTLNAAIGPCSVTCPEAQQDLTNLNSNTVMALYYADFAKLMQRLGTGTYDGVKGFGADAVVQIEPDLSGYAEMAVLSPSTKCYGFCTGTGNDPSLLKSSVKSSGYPLAAAYANNYRGFNQTLLHIRDTYAPNVRLAFHVSDWATGNDINTSTATTLNPTALGTQAGQFAAASGASAIDGTTSTYDLLFNDVGGADDGYYKYVLNKPRFWDQDNVTFPNFQRWESYVHAASLASNRKVIVWQIPIGNQLYLSENNTPGHYQDNRVQYFFGHIQELVSSGIVGLLFGTTIPASTNYWDATGDVVTNPASICDSDGFSSGTVVCTSVTSYVADDDGGYLRYSAQAYYTNPVPVAP